MVSESPQTDAKHKATFEWLESRVSLDSLVENSSGPGANSHSGIQLMFPILHLGVTTGRDLVLADWSHGKDEIVHNAHAYCTKK